MEMRKIGPKPDEMKEDKKSQSTFSRLKGMIETTAKVTAVTAALSLTLNCGGGSPTSDGGHVEDGGADVSDASTQQNDSGTGGMDSGTTSPGPCATYPQGDPHRRTFTLNNPDGIQGSQLSVNFLELDINGTGRSAIFMLFVTNPTTNYFTVVMGTPKHVNLADVGDNVFDICNATNNMCTNGTGDQSCSVTLASSRPWAL